MNLLQTFLDSIAGHEKDPFLTYPGGGPSLSFGEVFSRADELAGALTDRGLQADDRLVAQVAKSAEAFALYLACLQTGVVYVPLNNAYTANEVDYFLDDTGAALFVDDDVLTDLSAEARPLGRIEDRSDDDLACMLYTSGTTGRSKGAMLTHRNLAANGRALHQVWAFQPGDVLLHILPIFHVHGLFVALHCALLNASEVIFCPTFSVETVRAELPRSTVMMGVPTHYSRLLADPTFDAADCQNIRLFTSGSAPMTEAVFNDFTQRTGHVICERYGMTECGIITSNPYDGDRVAGTVGYPLPGVELEVRRDDGEPCPPGESGMVWTRGDSLGPGYWRLPDKTAEERDADGFFRTGDVGTLDETGRLTLAGRAGDMIISGGYNVYPKEIELVLDEVTGVRESAVVGVPHHDFGEGVVAVLVAEQPTQADALAAACTEACRDTLARFKHPKHYVVVEELPRNAMGKVQKAELRAAHAEAFSNRA